MPDKDYESFNALEIMEFFYTTPNIWIEQK